MSKCKILFTLVIWSVALSLEIARYTAEFIDMNNDYETSFIRKFQLNSLINNKPDYSIAYFATILITEYVPLSTLLYSILKSYLNNARQGGCSNELLED